MTLYEDELPIDEPGEFKYATDWDDTDLDEEEPRVSFFGRAIRAEEEPVALNDPFFGDIGHDAAEQAHDAGHQGENEDAVIAHNAAEQGEDAGYQAEQEGGDDENGGDNDDNNDNNQVQPPVVAAPAPTPAPNAPAPIAPAVAPPAPILPAVRKLVPKLKWTDAEDDEVLRIVEEIVSQQQRQVTIQDCNGIEVALAAAFQGRWTSVGDGLVRGKNVATAEWLYPPRNARAIERRLKGPGRLLTEYNEILERYGVAKYH